MRFREIIAFVGALALTNAPAFAQTRLPNGWAIAPAGRLTPLTTMPVHAVFDPSGRWLAVSNTGFSGAEVDIVDARSGAVVTRRPLENTFYGLAFSPSGDRLYVSAQDMYAVRDDPYVVRFAFDARTGDLTRGTLMPIGLRDGRVAGLAAAPDGATVYAAIYNADALVAFDPLTGDPRWSAPVGATPYAVALARRGALAFVSGWNAATVTAVDTRTGSVAATIAVGAHPNALTVSHDGASVYVACANADEVDAIDVATLRVRERIATRLDGNALPGGSPQGLALSSDDRTLYVAAADLNAVLVFRRADRFRLAGAVPTGWYPTDVALGPNDDALLVVNGKGDGQHPNPLYRPWFTPGPQLGARPAWRGVSYYDGDPLHYVADNEPGMLQRVDRLDGAALRDGLRTVAAGPPPRLRVAGTRLPPISHIIYVVKENRTYDQLLGDDPRGNGDPRLAMFGRSITPNVHKLVSEFPLLDNYYLDGEVTRVGRLWVEAAYADDFVEKEWQANYADREMLLPAELRRPPGGYLWDLFNAHGISFRDYGEYTNTSSGLAVPIGGEPGLVGHLDPAFPALTSDQDELKLAEWLREFRAFERDGNLPAFEFVTLNGDHTRGTVPYKRTPDAFLARNDLAVGELIAAVSRSRYWRDTVIFVTEDDAQNGPDHVSAQRSYAIVAGAYVKRGGVDHTHYSLTGMIRTMELLLGLPPMNQFDAAATPLSALFSAAPDDRPYEPVRETVDLDETNAPYAVDAARSARLDFSQPDRADGDELNAILWDYVRSRGRV